MISCELLGDSQPHSCGSHFSPGAGTIASSLPRVAKLTVIATTCVAAVCGGTESSACLHQSMQQGHSLQPAGPSAWCSLAGQGAGSQSGCGGSLEEMLCKFPRAGTKAFFIRPERSMAEDECQRNLSGVSRGKAPSLRSEPPDFAKCLYLSFSSVKNKLESRSVSLASGLRRRTRASSSCSSPARPCHVTAAPEPGRLLNSASSLRTPLP